jgi:subfamily B ATP-binding cassette protein MsbA
MRDILRLAGYLAPYKGRIVLGIVASLLASLCLGGFMLLVRPIADGIFRNSARPGAANSAAAAVQGLVLPGTGADSASAGSAAAGATGGTGESSGANVVEGWRAWLKGLQTRIRHSAVAVAANDWLIASPFTRVPLMIVLLFFIKDALTYFAEYWLKWVGYRMIQDLRVALYDRIVNQSARFFSAHPTGLLMSRVMSDVSRLQRVASTNFADGMRFLCTVIVAAFLVFYISWRLSIVCLIGMPLVLFPLVRFGKRLKSASHRSQEKAADVSNILNETISGNRIVKAFGMEDFERTRFRSSLVKMFRSDAKALRIVALTSPFLEFVGALLGAGLFWYAGNNIRTGMLDGSGFLSFLLALGYLFVNLKALSAMNNDLQQAAAAAARVFQMIDLPNEIADAPGAKELASFAREVRFRNVSFRYEDRMVLDGIDLVVKAGEVHALVGGSGAGKTTLVNLIPRFYDVTGGTVEIDGTDIRTVTLSSLRRQVALVTQETILFNDSVRNNIAYGNRSIPSERIEAAARAANAHSFIMELPRTYDSVVGERGTMLSAGQRQRVTIARALLKNAPLLILDEATSALDAESEALVQQALEFLMRDRTSIVIAHRLSTIRRADRIHVLEGGKIIESGSHEELLSRGGAYARLYQLQFSEQS